MLQIPGIFLGLTRIIGLIKGRGWRDYKALMPLPHQLDLLQSHKDLQTNIRNDDTIGRSEVTNNSSLILVNVLTVGADVLSEFFSSKRRIFD